jgi:tripartite-type tricarboxylate transporter receptor subunit TctC
MQLLYNESVPARTLLFAALLAPLPLLAQYPARAITLVVPFSPGTGIDILARACGQKLSERWGVAAPVENRPGASGNIGAELVANAPADGQTLLVTATSFAVNPAVNRVRYDPLRGFAPVALLATATLALAVHDGVPARNLRELIAYARSRPGGLDYASPGNGTVQHLATELFKQAAGVDLRHVPYKEAAGATRELAAGIVSAMILPVHTAAPLVHAGRVRLLAVIGEERSPVFPDVPTLAEAGVAGVDASVWYALLAPAATPPAVVQKLNAELNAILAAPELKDALGRQGLVPAGGSPERLAAHLRAEVERWARVAAAARIQAD